MKKFLSGFMTCAIILGISFSALAITGRITIDVDPINIQVNGATFVPRDINGAEVPVFAYNGTTYAPLRALAEAYGLEVGYDPATNMATVVDPDASVAPADDTKTAFGKDYSTWSSDQEAEYQAFKSMWDIEFLRYSKDDTGTEHAMFDATCVDEAYSYASLTELYNNKRELYDRLGLELLQESGAEWVNIFFKGADGYWAHHFVHE